MQTIQTTFTQKQIERANISYSHKKTWYGAWSIIAEVQIGTETKSFTYNSNDSELIDDIISMKYDGKTYDEVQLCYHDKFFKYFEDKIEEFWSNLVSEIQEKLNDNFFQYASNMIPSDELFEKTISPIVNCNKAQESKIMEVFAEYDKIINDLPCEAEGYTPEQEKEVDAQIFKMAQEIVEILKTN